MTLVELLVVLTILLMIVGATIPLMSSALEGRRQREAARMLSAYLDAARARAREIGRPAGVQLTRATQLGMFALEVSMIEEPPPYSGGELTSYAWVGRDDVALDPSNPSETVKVLRADLRSGFDSTLITANDFVQLNFQGPRYRIFGPPLGNNGDLAGGDLMLSIPGVTDPREGPPAPPGHFLPWPQGSRSPVPYQVFRKPFKSTAPALQLPTGTAIDLVYSGMGTELFQPRPGDNVLYTDPLLFDWYKQEVEILAETISILFSPRGGIARLEFTTIQPPQRRLYTPVLPIYLLVGKRDKVVPVGQRNLVATNMRSSVEHNWRDPECLWLVIQPNSGQVTTAEVVPTPEPVPPAAADYEYVRRGIIASRSLAQAGLQIGGR